MAEKKKITNPYDDRDLIALRALSKTFRDRIAIEKVDAIKAALERELRNVLFALKNAKYKEFKKEEEKIFLELKDLGWKPKPRK